MKTRSDFELRKISDDIYLLEQQIQDIAEPVNKIITFNKTAALVWREVQKKDFDVNTISNILRSTYVISAETSLSDAKDLIQTWMDAKLAY